jgi:16S rRNA (cytosine967-C5)-methyltransferase
VQARLLEGAAGAVRPGGHLIYSTCSLEPEENEERVAAFLRVRDDFVVEPTDAVDARFLDGDGFLRVLPQDTGFDGAFAARLRRAA